MTREYHSWDEVEQVLIINNACNIENIIRLDLPDIDDKLEKYLKTDSIYVLISIFKERMEHPRISEFIDKFIELYPNKENDEYYDVPINKIVSFCSKQQLYRILEINNLETYIESYVLQDLIEDYSDSTEKDKLKLRLEKLRNKYENDIGSLVRNCFYTGSSNPLTFNSDTMREITRNINSGLSLLQTATTNSGLQQGPLQTVGWNDVNPPYPDVNLADNWVKYYYPPAINNNNAFELLSFDESAYIKSENLTVNIEEKEEKNED